MQRLRIADAPGTYHVTCSVCQYVFRYEVAAPDSGQHTGDCDFVVYDLETTGLRPDFEEFIQIAAMRFRKGRLVPSESFFSFARPEQPIPTFITTYTGITNADVRLAPRPHEVLVEFSRFVRGSRLIAHNGHRFDSKFLGATCRRHGMPMVDVRSIGSINLSKRMFGTVRGTGHSLDRVLSRLGISADGHARHDARGDVELLGKAIERMWNRLGLDDHCTGIPFHFTSLPKDT
jgi:DNA polymerase-3 subunit epsilon